MAQKDYLLHFSIISFTEGDTHIAYCPELELKAYGFKADEAEQGIKSAFRNLFKEYRRPHDFMAYLKKLGYETKITKTHCELLPPEHEDLLRENILYRSLSRIPNIIKDLYSIKFSL